MLAPKCARMGYWHPYRMLQSGLIKAWYDETTTLDTTGWADRSGNSHMALRVTGAVLTGTRRGRRTTMFSGSTYYQASFEANQPCEVWVAGSWSGAYFTDAFMVDGDAGGAGFRRSATNSIYVHAGYGYTATTTALSNRWLVMRAVLNGAASSFWIDGACAFEQDLGGNNPGGITLGARWDGSLPLLGYQGEVLVTYPLNAVLAARLAGSLSRKWV